VDAVFDGVGGTHIWRSREALRSNGTVVAYGITSSLHRGRLASGCSQGRHRFRAIAIFGLYIAASWLLPGRKRVVPYSIQWLKRLRPWLFRESLLALFGRRFSHSSRSDFPLRRQDRRTSCSKREA
jgi:NADPH2:quinone reductase